MNASQHTENNRLIIIDDNPAIHQDIRKILANTGQSNLELSEAKALLFDEAPAAPSRVEFEIDSAYQGEEGLDLVRQALQAGRPYALAFVDIRMPPGWDGVETVARIWKDAPDLQVVICTAYSDYSWEEMLRKLGRTDSLVILKKPFDNIELLQLAHTLTEKWALTYEVKCRLNNLDQLVTQRTTELQGLNERLKQELAEQTKLEGQLRQSQKLEAIGQLAAGVAHDFNNILTVVQGHASLMLATRPPDSPDCKPLQSISAAAERATRLIRQLLTFSRKQVMQFRPLDIRATLTSISEMLPRLLGEHIAIDLSLPATLPQVTADSGMIEQMLINLAVNARDAMPRGGSLALDARQLEIHPNSRTDNPEARPGSYLCLSVADTGCGIPPENLARVFEPFFTTKPIGKGTGLGLATVYGIARQHQGWVEVQSEVGKGTTFKVFIPVSAQQPVAAPPVPAPSAVFTGGKETILVAEDEDDVRDFVVEVLKTHGYTVFSAASGPEAVEHWLQRKEQIDLLLTDMVMPGGMTGRELGQLLIAQRPRLPIIYTSGYSPGMAGRDMAVVEGQNFLPKPYVPSRLLQMVRESLDRRSPGLAAAPR